MTSLVAIVACLLGLPRDWNSVGDKIAFVTKLMAKSESVDGAPIILARPTGDETHGGGPTPLNHDGRPRRVCLTRSIGENDGGNVRPMLA
jgi:hypothetical protein